MPANLPQTTDGAEVAEAIEPHLPDTNEARLAEARRVLEHFVEFAPKYFRLKTSDRALAPDAALDIAAGVLEDVSIMAFAVASMERGLKHGDLVMFGIACAKFQDVLERLRVAEADFVVF